MLLYICISFGAGALAHFSMAPYNFPPILLVAFPCFYYVLTKTEKTGTRFIYTWFFAFGYFLFSLSWIGNALLIPGNEEFLWAYPLALIGLPILLALFPAFGVSILTRGLDYTRLEGWFGFVFAYTLSEVARGYLFTGFPWNSFGYTWFEVKPVLQLVSIGGIYFLTILTVLWACVPALFFVYHTPGKVRTAITGICVLTLISGFIYGNQRISSNPPPPPSSSSNVMVHIIQPNIAQHLKWERDQIYNHHLQLLSLTEQAVTPYPDKINLVIWPETATTISYLTSPDIKKEIERILGDNPQNRLITGILRFEQNTEKRTLYNSLSVFTPDLTVEGIYDKHHLVPFGEYIPFKEFIPLTTITQFSGFKPGTGPHILTAEPQEALILPLICYESIFPKNVFPDNGHVPTLLVNVTNDGWYGNSAGPRQHMVQSVFRAVETGLPIIRSANTGISIVSDPLGHILEELPLETRGSISIPLPHPLQKPTPYSNNRTILILGLFTFFFILSRFLKHKK
jgi:apolipoprotein N-acyltransferase